jgi:hypothetical protein
MLISEAIRKVIVRVRGEATLIPASEWTLLSMMDLIRTVGVMGARGTALRPFLGSSKGLLLIGRGTTLRNTKHLHTGNSTIIEDFVEIQALSKRGIHLSNNTSLGRYTVVRPTGNYGGAHTAILGARGIYQLAGM